MAKKIICLVAALVLVVSCFVVPSFAAAEQNNYIQYANFPSLNAFPYPYQEQSGFMADYIGYGTDTITKGKYIYFTGTPEGGFLQARSTFILTGWKTGTLMTTTVTFSTQLTGLLPAPTTTASIMRCQVEHSDGTFSYYSARLFESVTFDMAYDDKLNVYLRFDAYDEVTPFSFYPVLNFGDVAYPYQPYINYQLEQNYQAGYDEGEAADNESVYDEGFQDGYDSADRILNSNFNNCTVDISFWTNGAITERVNNVPFDKSVDGIYFKSTLRFLEGNGYQTALENCDHVTVWVHFDEYFVYGVNPINIVGSTLVEYAVANIYSDYYGEGGQYEMIADRASSNDVGTFTIINGAPPTSPAYVRNISIQVGRPTDLLLEFTLFSTQSGYSTGYYDGYREGLSATGTENYDKGFADGRKEGFAEGKKEGLAVADNGDWLSLFTSVIEAPVVAFQSLFNFDIFGFDMRNMVTSILTICVFVVILKKVGAV